MSEPMAHLVAVTVLQLTIASSVSAQNATANPPEQREGWVSQPNGRG